MAFEVRRETLLTLGIKDAFSHFEVTVHTSDMERRVAFESVLGVQIQTLVTIKQKIEDLHLLHLDS